MAARTTHRTTRTSGRRTPGVAPVVSPRFGQSIAALWFDIAQPSERWAGLVDQMAAALKLDQRISRLPATENVYEARLGQYHS
jgi:hypothetical protein